ncbi:anthranilate phosphoribosyltransferase [Amorphus sp. MBR-141]
MTRTLVKMRVSPETFDEISAHFLDVGYQHVFMADGSLNMDEIALERDPRLTRRATEESKR